MTHATETQCTALLGVLGVLRVLRVLVERRDRATRAGILAQPGRDWIATALNALEQRGYAESSEVGVQGLRWYTATPAGVAAVQGEVARE